MRTILKIALIAALVLGLGGPAMAQGCLQLIAKLTQLDLSQGSPLLTAGGKSFEALYDECDAHDTFNGAALPSGRKCSTDKNRVDNLLKFPDGTVYFQAKMSVDADGSPLAQAETGTNQAETWLTFDAGSESHYVNAEDVPFIVVPGASGSIKFQTQAKVKRGDLAVVIKGARCSFGVVGDSGPPFRLGEASLQSHEDLGNPQCKSAGEYPCTKLKGGGSGISIPSGVTYIIFPATRPVPLQSQTVVEVAGEAAKLAALAFADAYKAP